MKRDKPKIFVDTAIFRYAASVKLVQSAKLEEGTITSNNGESRGATFLVYKNEVKEIGEADISLEREKSAIRKIADLTRDRNISLFYSHEVNLELLFQPEVDLAVGRMKRWTPRIGQHAKVDSFFFEERIRWQNAGNSQLISRPRSPWKLWSVTRPWPNWPRSTASIPT